MSTEQTFSASSTLSPLDAQTQAHDKFMQYLQENQYNKFTAALTTDKAEGPRITYYAFYVVVFDE